MNRGNSIDFTFLALLGTYALSFQRLLPIAQSMYKGFNYVKRYSADLKDVLELSIKKDDFYSSKQPFTKQIDIEEIVVKDINFSYKRNGKNLFNKINFKLIPGDFLGIMGKSGSGKSTLIDILLGLLIPSNGHVFINEIDINLSESKEYLERWQNSISYVPQSPLILNDTIKKNLQINGSKNQNISEKDIYDVLEVVQLKHFVSSLPFKFETILGDDGNTKVAPKTKIGNC